MELAVILLIAILLFGANKIPKLARSTGEAMGEFKKGREAVEQELEEMRDGVPVEEADTEFEPADTESPPSGEATPEADEEPVDSETETEER